MHSIHFETIDSTNAWLKRHWNVQPDMTFVRADYQSQGRGRGQRRWFSQPDENLMFSLLIKDGQLMAKHQLISLVSAFSIALLLEEQGLKSVMIKWPNDVYAEDRKICGILLEGVSQNELQCLIIGIGLNVNQLVFEGEYLREPASMYQLTGRKYDISQLAFRAYAILMENLNALKQGEDFLPRLRQLNYLQDRLVSAMIDGNRKTVAVRGLNDDGSLKVEVDGQETDVTSGEISFHV